MIGIGLKDITAKLQLNVSSMLAICMHLLAFVEHLLAVWNFFELINHY